VNYYFMKNKIIFSIVSLVMVMVLGIGFININSAGAQVSSFPAGCSSALGYSVTTSLPCNGTSVATNGPLLGCSTALGYSVVNGTPCSGASFAIFYLAGCTSTDGYSIYDGKPCNGTAVATMPVVVPPPTTTPGLPTTGYRGNALENMLLLAISGFIAISGLVYIGRKPSIA
jgi:hypothetical protein